MNKKLYVGNLSYETTEAELTELFAQAGTVVETNVIFDRYTGRSKGFGFVEMADEAAAAAAIERFNGSEIGGRSLRVAEARPRQRREESRYDSRW